MISREIDKTKLGIDLSWGTFRDDIIRLIGKQKGNLIGLPIETNIAQDKLAKEWNEDIEKGRMLLNPEWDDLEVLLNESNFCHRCGVPLRLNLIQGFNKECLCEKCKTALDNDSLLGRFKVRSKAQEYSRSDRVVRGLML